MHLRGRLEDVFGIYLKFLEEEIEAVCLTLWQIEDPTMLL
jgi:hypothetical protein